MKLKEYILALQEIAKEHGDDLDLIYSSDDEGNSYHQVYCEPSIKYTDFCDDFIYDSLEEFVESYGFGDGSLDEEEQQEAEEEFEKFTKVVIVN